MILKSKTVKEFLKAELDRRMKVNQRYSQRAFAKSLGLSPGELSELLREKRTLSLKSALRISKAMGFNSTETKYLVHLAQLDKSRRDGESDLLETSLEEQVMDHGTLSEDVFHVVSDWFYFAILNLIDCEGFEWDASYISGRLGITKVEAQVAMDRLIRMQIVVKNEAGRYHGAKDFVLSPSGVPSEAVRNYHRQMIKKALYALEMQPVQDRDISGIGFACHLEDLEAIRKEISEFQDQLASKYSKSRSKTVTDVFHLEVALFKLTQGIGSDHGK